MTNFKAQQNSVNQIHNQIAFLFFLLKGFTWYYHDIYIVFTYIASFTGYADDLFKVWPWPLPFNYKVDGVGPVDNRPSIDQLNHFVHFFLFFFIKNADKKYFVMWQVTPERWHVTCDTWYIIHSVGWTFSQNFSSLVFPVLDWQCLKYIWTEGWVT